MGAGQNPSPPPPPPPPSGGWDGRDWKEWGRNLESNIRQRSAQADGRWRRSPAPHRMVMGMIIVAIGLVLLLDNLGIPGFGDLWRFWPVILIVISLSKIVENPSPAGFIWGLVVGGVGTVFLLDHLGVHVNLSIFWPVILIGFGLSMLA